MNTTQRLLATLWRRFGSREFPAEWDGEIYGGGTLSQRYWEYLETIKLLDLSPTSVVLDIGGGSPVTGAGFLASLLATEIQQVVIIDPHLSLNGSSVANIVLIREEASAQVLKDIFAARPEITHVTSVSVFEHIEPEVRDPIVRAINDSFRGTSFVTTFEYHARRRCFEHQLTARTTSALFKSLRNFYPDEIRASPVWGESSYDSSRLIKLSRNGPIDPGDIPLWYPLAVRFVRLPDIQDAALSVSSD